MDDSPGNNRVSSTSASMRSRRTSHVHVKSRDPGTLSRSSDSQRQSGWILFRGYSSCLQHRISAVQGSGPSRNHGCPPTIPTPTPGWEDTGWKDKTESTNAQTTTKCCLPDQRASGHNNCGHENSHQLRLLHCDNYFCNHISMV